MNVRLLGVVAAMSAMGLVACGDDTGGGGGAGGGGTGGDAATTGTTTATTGTGGGDATTATTTTTGTGGGETGGGDPGTGGAGGGGVEAPVCAEACADEPACDTSPPDVPVDSACSDCVDQAASDFDACALQNVTDDCCQADADCAAFVDCVLSGEDRDVCQAANEAGYARANECTFFFCGACGDPG